MHFRTLCPSVMLASFHSGAVTSQFKVQTAGRGRTVSGGDWSWCDPRESDEDENSALSETEKMEVESDDDKENGTLRAGKGFFLRRNSASSPMEIKRQPMEPVNTIRRTPGMGFSPFSRGIQFAESIPRKSPSKSPSPPSPELSPRPLTRLSPPLSPLINAPEAKICGAWPQKGWRTRRIPSSPFSERRAMKREFLQGKQRSSLPMRTSKTTLAMNPNQRFALVCRNDRFYWVSKEVNSFDRY